MYRAAGHSRECVEALREAVLAKAFRGELVPTEVELARREGREYDPADVLLEGVRADPQSWQEKASGWGRRSAGQTALPVE
jgi:type I restriction enzyme S subunit